MVKMTTWEFANRLGSDYPVAYELVKLLEKRGEASKVGVKYSGNPGRPEDVYELPDSVVLVINPVQPSVIAAS